MSILSTTASTIQSASPTKLKSSSMLPTEIKSILLFSTNSGGRDINILSLAFCEIWFFEPFFDERSKSVTKIPAFATWAAMPLPVVPEPIMTTF